MDAALLDSLRSAVRAVPDDRCIRTCGMNTVASVFRSAWLIVLAIAIVAGCSGPGGSEAARPPVPFGAPDTTQQGTLGSDSNNDLLPEPDPAFARHFTDPVYSDAAGEFAPFGTDEGADLLAVWGGRRDELDDDSRVSDLIDEMFGFEWVDEALDGPQESGKIPEPAGQVDAAVITIGAGFTLLRLTGHIDDEGRRMTLTALDILIRRYDSPPELLRQRDDLLAWQN